MLPTDVLREKADKYVEAKYLTAEQAVSIIRVIEQERNFTTTANDGVADEPASSGANRCSHKLTPAQLQDLLTDREAKMRASKHGGVTDQWRVYKYITDSIAHGKWLRLMVQASAGTGSLVSSGSFTILISNREGRAQKGFETRFAKDPDETAPGKSFLLATVYLWCIVQSKKCKAAAPTGIVLMDATQICPRTPGHPDPPDTWTPRRPDTRTTPGHPDISV